MWNSSCLESTGCDPTGQSVLQRSQGWVQDRGSRGQELKLLLCVSWEGFGLFHSDYELPWAWRAAGRNAAAGVPRALLHQGCGSTTGTCPVFLHGRGPAPARGRQLHLHVLQELWITSAASGRRALRLNIPKKDLIPAASLNRSSLSEAASRGGCWLVGPAWLPG